MTKTEIDFLIENKINFESVKLGFTRNVPFDILAQYESIYRKYLDAKFVLTYWCGSCVFEMMERLIYFCETQDDYNQATNPQTYETTNVEPAIELNESEVTTKRRGRPKKSQ
jgi:hypothetical protein